jgi:catechol 2,3-dioxygenase-like lactoylglutathione lyase family enzyme
MRIVSVASVSPIARDADAAKSLYEKALGLSFEGGEGDYVFTEQLPGVRHLGLWPLTEAAKACFGGAEWPSDIPVPQASVEFEVGSVEDVAGAAQELRASGHELLHDSRQEPWGQTITRLLSRDGLLVGICYTPWFHELRA